MKLCNEKHKHGGEMASSRAEVRNGGVFLPDWGDGNNTRRHKSWMLHILRVCGSESAVTKHWQTWLERLRWRWTFRERGTARKQVRTDACEWYTWYRLQDRSARACVSGPGRPADRHRRKDARTGERCILRKELYPSIREYKDRCAIRGSGKPQPESANHGVIGDATHAR